MVSVLENLPYKERLKHLNFSTLKTRIQGNLIEVFNRGVTDF